MQGILLARRLELRVITRNADESIGFDLDAFIPLNYDNRTALQISRTDWTKLGERSSRCGTGIRKWGRTAVVLRERAALLRGASRCLGTLLNLSIGGLVVFAMV